MFNTITTCRLSHYFRLKTCSSFLSHSQVFHLMFVIKYVTVLSGKYPANFTRIPDSAGCLHFTGYRIVLSGSGTSLLVILFIFENKKVASCCINAFCLCWPLIMCSFSDSLQRQIAWCERFDIRWPVNCNFVAVTEFCRCATCCSDKILLR